MPNTYHSYKIFPDMPHSSMLKVEGGRFIMGPDQEKDRNLLREVEVSSFYIGQYPVSQGLWERVMGENPAEFQGNEQLPIEGVSWYDTIEFCNALSELVGLEAVYEIDKRNIDQWEWIVKRKEGALGYRLPTDEEWEYAARGGIYARKTVYAGSNQLKEVGWYGNDRKNVHGWTETPGLRIPNELGLYDMSGNVREWCDDEVQDYPVLRGGSWDHAGSLCRVSASRKDYPYNRFNYVGFRVAGYLKP